MKKPLVSVIMPYYKKINFFQKAYFSIQNQSYKNLEIIIIYDDPSKLDLDNIKKIIKKKNTKIVINKNNLGAGASRNLGIKISKGQYIAFIDSDDVWHKNKIKTQINFMMKTKYNFTHTSYSIIDKNNKLVGKRVAKNKISFQELLHSCDIGLSTVIVKKKILENLKFPRLKTKEDYVLWLNISKNTQIIGMNEQLVNWRKLDNSLSSDALQKVKDGFKVYNYYMKFNIFKSLYYLSLLSLNFIIKNYLQKN